MKRRKAGRGKEGRSRQDREVPAKGRSARASSGGSQGKGRRSTEGRHRRPVAEKLSHISARTAILVILLAIFVAFAVGPVTRNLEATARLKKKEAELKEQESATASLEEEVREARSLEYVEKEARRQRLVAPGEVLYLVTPDESESEVEYRVKNLQSMDEAWERVRQMLNCTHSRDTKKD